MYKNSKKDGDSMFCIKCGEKLPEDALFCHKCGNRVSVEVKTEEKSKLVYSEPFKEFNVLQQTIKFPLIIKGYASVRSYFDDNARKATAKYKNRFKGRYNSIKDFVEYANGDFNSDLFDACHEAVLLLNNNGIYNITDSIFYDEVNRRRLLWRMRFEYIKKQKDYIEEQGNLQKQYREIRKDSRGKLVGGGIGIEGAVKGMAVAGGVNLATGVAHSFLNGIGNYKTDLDVIDKEKRLFQDEYQFEKLQEAYYFDILKVHEVFIDYLFEYKNKERISYYGYEAYTKACNILDNVENGNVQGENVKNALVEALKINPFDENIYYYILQYEQDREDVDNLVEFLNINIEEIRKKIELEKAEKRQKEEILNKLEEIAKEYEEQEKEEKLRIEKEKEQEKERRRIDIEPINLDEDSTIADSEQKEEFIEDVKQYLIQLRNKGKWCYRLHVIRFDKPNKEMISNIKKSYNYQEGIENAILVLDATLVSESAKVGVIISTRYVYIKTSKLSKVQIIKLQDIKTIESKGSSIYINGINLYVPLTDYNEEEQEEYLQLIAGILHNCINRLRKLSY